MKIVFENCILFSDKEINSVETMLVKLMQPYLQYIEYIVISNDNHEIFDINIKKYSETINGLIDTSTNNSNGCAFGKCLSGFLNGQDVYILVYKESIIKSFIENNNDICASCFFHEVGHVYWNKLFNKIGYSTSNKVNYNLKEEDRLYRHDSSFNCINEFLAQLYANDVLAKNNYDLDTLLNEQILDMSQDVFYKDKLKNYEKINYILYRYSLLYSFLFLLGKANEIEKYIIIDETRNRKSEIIDCFIDIGKEFDKAITEFNQEVFKSIINNLSQLFIKLLNLLTEDF